MIAIERLREMVRSEVAAQRPIESVAGTLELLAESSVRRAEANGTDRPIELVVRDVVTALRRENRDLFMPTADGGLDAEPILQSDAPDAAPPPMDGAPGATSPPESPDLSAAPPPEASARNKVQAPDPRLPQVAAGPYSVPFASESTTSPVDRSIEPSGSPAVDPPADPAAAKRDWLLLATDGSTHLTLWDRRKEALALVGGLAKKGVAAKDMVTRGVASRAAAARALASNARRRRGAASEHTGPGQARPAAGRRRSLNRLAYIGAGLLALVIVGPLLLGAGGETPSAGLATDRTDTQSAARAPDPETTGAIERPEPSQAPVRRPASTPPRAAQAQPPAAAPASAPPPVSLRGVPEVIDTVTLRVDGKLARLFGVEWARGGKVENLTRYLGDREIACELASAPDVYRCRLGDQDLSRVVLYNGGGRASSDAPPELVAAEQHAKAKQTGVWQK